TVSGFAVAALKPVATSGVFVLGWHGKTEMPLAVPVAMPMLRSGDDCHQRLMRSMSVVAAYKPVSQAGSLPRGWQGKTASPFCASCNAAACRVVIVCSTKFGPRAGYAAQGLLLLDGDGVVELLRERQRCLMRMAS